MFVALSIIFVATGLLVISPSYRLVKLFLSRAASMGGFTTLFIYTPEVSPLSSCNALGSSRLFFQDAISDLGFGTHPQGLRKPCLHYSIQIDVCPVSDFGMLQTNLPLSEFSHIS